MAFAATKIATWRVDSVFTPAGILIKELWSFVQLATDGGGTFTTGSGIIKAVIGNGNILDKSLSFAFSGSVVTVDASGAGGPTLGWVEVTLLRRA